MQRPSLNWLRGGETQLGLREVHRRPLERRNHKNSFSLRKGCTSHEARARGGHQKGYVRKRKRPSLGGRIHGREKNGKRDAYPDGPEPRFGGASWKGRRTPFVRGGELALDKRLTNRGESGLVAG